MNRALDDCYLRLDKRLAQGRTRDIFFHPSDRCRLVKVARSEDGGASGPSRSVERANERELATYTLLKDQLVDYLTDYDLTLATTDRGPGLVCRAVMDVNGKVSTSFHDRLAKDPGCGASLRRLFDRFFDHLFSQRCYFFDFNPGNFLLQNTATDTRIRFVDLKSYRHDRALLPIARWSEVIARRKMQRRRDRFFDQWFR